MRSPLRSFGFPLVLFATVAAAGLGAAGCKRKHIPVPSVSELGYPTCPSSSAASAPVAAASGSASATGAAPAMPRPAVLLAEGNLRSGVNDTRSPIVERFRIEKRDCFTVATIHQEWSHQIADVEAIFDEAGTPLRVWRRWTSPLSKRADGNADYKRFDFRTPFITAKHKNDAGIVDFEEIHGPRPKALIGSGHGLLTVWIQRAKLQVGEKLREPAFDFRGVEVSKEVTLFRHPDKDEPTLGRKVRVYTIYGREGVFTDENDVVVGDVAGLVPWEKSPLPVPRPLPGFEGVDPVGTPLAAGQLPHGGLRPSAQPVALLASVAPFASFAASRRETNAPNAPAVKNIIRL